MDVVGDGNGVRDRGERIDLMGGVLEHVGDDLLGVCTEDVIDGGENPSGDIKNVQRSEQDPPMCLRRIN